MLDLRPPSGEIRVVTGQGPDAVQMIRQLNPGIDRERTACAHRTDGVTQRVKDEVVAQDGTAAPGDDGEEKGETGGRAAEVGHGAIVVCEAEGTEYTKSEA